MNPLDLPLFNIDDFQYEGAFRVPANTYGSSSLNYSQGPIAYNADNHSIYIVGHAHHQEIAEFAIPALVKSSDLSDLNMASDPMQYFSSVLDKASNGNSQNIDRIGGIYYMQEGGSTSLLINGYEYYDAAGDNTHTSLMLEDPVDLANSAVTGFYEFQGGAGHTSGWISTVPQEWQNLLGGSMLTGQSSGIPIISRTSVGPSAFSFDAGNIPSAESTSNTINTNKLLDFSLANPLHEDLSNDDLTNKVWTHLSRVTYGVIIPGTRTYFTIGYSGGHESGVCYKCTQDDGNLCGGYCSPVADDNSPYYWLWDVADMIKVKNGILNPWEVEPYDFGPLNIPFGSNEIGGGSFDPISGILYLSIQYGDNGQGTYARPPLITAFSFSSSVLPVELISFEGIAGYKMINLHWQTQNEIEVDQYILEEWDGNYWEEIGSHPSLGNSNKGHNYSLTINDSGSGVRIFRLKILDNNDKFRYSKTIKVIGKNEEFTLVPNPVTSTLWINGISNEGVSVDVLIFNAAGQLILRQRIDIAKNEKEMIGVFDLKPGVYIVQLVYENKIARSLRFVKM
jgi:hypothetical protein